MMTRLHTCPEENCGHYTWSHTRPGVAGGCLVIVAGGACCGCIRQFEDGIADPLFQDPFSIGKIPSSADPKKKRSRKNVSKPKS